MPFKKDDPNINREGRPKGSVSVVSAIKRKLEECPKGDEKTYLERLVEKIMDKALTDSDVVMIKDIINRVDGMPQQKTDITSGGKPIIIESSKEGIDKYKLYDADEAPSGNTEGQPQI